MARTIFAPSDISSYPGADGVIVCKNGPALLTDTTAAVIAASVSKPKKANANAVAAKTRIRMKKKLQTLQITGF